MGSKVNGKKVDNCFRTMKLIVKKTKDQSTTNQLIMKNTSTHPL